MQDSGGPITHDMNSPEIYATVFSLGPGKTDVNILWAGSDDGVVQITRDGGKTWTSVTPPEMPDFGRVSQIDASIFDPGTAYVAVKKPLLGDFSPYIFRTHDYGRTWTKIVNGIPAKDWAHVVREDPTRRGMLYAGTAHGLYLSYDDGDHWQSLRLNLPDTPISDLWVEANDLAIATHGRGFYVLDSIGPLRQYGQPVITATDSYLFKPGDLVRGGGGATISYWLKKPAQNLKLEILDSSGRVIRSIDGAMPKAPAAPGADASPSGAGSAGTTPAPSVPGTPAAAPAPGTPPAGEEQPQEDEDDFPRRGPQTASMAAGLQRFTWDVRHQPVVNFPGMVLWGATTNGPMALAGSYQARLTVDGKPQTASFELKKDPWRNVSDADLREQFDLATRIRDKVNEANNSVIQIRHLKQQLDDRTKQTSNADVKAIAEQFAKELTTVEESVYQVRNRSNQDPLNFPIKTNNRLASLLRVVEAGDGKPIGNVEPIFNDLQGELKAETDRLQRTIATYLQRFNQAAQRAGLKPITEK
jgi:hypothetical protein